MSRPLANASRRAATTLLLVAPCVACHPFEDTERFEFPDAAIDSIDPGDTARPDLVEPDLVEPDLVDPDLIEPDVVLTGDAVVYVDGATMGVDADGTPMAPAASILEGLRIAEQRLDDGLVDDVELHIAASVAYDEDLLLEAPTIDLLGGYDPESWEPDPQLRTVVQGRLEIVGSDELVRLSRLEIDAVDSPATHSQVWLDNALVALDDLSIAFDGHALAPVRIVNGSDVTGSALQLLADVATAPDTLTNLTDPDWVRIEASDVALKSLTVRPLQATSPVRAPRVALHVRNATLLVPGALHVELPSIPVDNALTAAALEVSAAGRLDAHHVTLLGADHYRATYALKLIERASAVMRGGRIVGGQAQTTIEGVASHALGVFVDQASIELHDVSVEVGAATEIFGVHLSNVIEAWLDDVHISPASSVTTATVPAELGIGLFVEGGGDDATAPWPGPHDEATGACCSHEVADVVVHGGSIRGIPAWRSFAARLGGNTLMRSAPTCIDGTTVVGASVEAEAFTLPSADVVGAVTVGVGASNIDWLLHNATVTGGDGGILSIAAVSIGARAAIAHNYLRGGTAVTPPQSNVDAASLGLVTATETRVQHVVNNIIHGGDGERAYAQVESNVTTDLANVRHPALAAGTTGADVCSALVERGIFEIACDMTGGDWVLVGGEAPWADCGLEQLDTGAEVSSQPLWSMPPACELAALAAPTWKPTATDEGCGLGCVAPLYDRDGQERYTGAVDVAVDDSDTCGAYDPPGDDGGNSPGLAVGPDEPL